MTDQPMAKTPYQTTIVIQTFRDHDIPIWIARCLESVQTWTYLHGYNYWLAGDEFFDLCGADYLAKGNKNPRAITNLARLVATRQKLDGGYDKVIWMDADVFVFDPERLVLNLPAEKCPTGYAFGREVWIDRDGPGPAVAHGPQVHNAVTCFTRAEVDLDMLIALIRQIDAGRAEISNFQVGVRLLRGLHYPLMFPTFSHVGVFSPAFLKAIAMGDDQTLKIYGERFGYHSCAANLTLSRSEEIDEKALHEIMNILESDKGATVNRFAKYPHLDLIPYTD